MWTAETRRIYDRKGLRYPTDVTDAEWALARPVIDVAQRGPRRQRRADLREVLNAVFYVLGTGCQWRALPKDLPPRSTVHDYFVRWQCDGTLSRLHHALYEQARELAGKCLVAEHSWDRVGWAIEACAWRFEGRARPSRPRRS